MTPLAFANGWPLSVIVLASVVGTITVAVVFGGIPKPSEYSHGISEILSEGAGAVGLDVQEIVARHSAAAGLTADEGNPPRPAPWQPGEGEEAEEDEE